MPNATHTGATRSSTSSTRGKTTRRRTTAAGGKDAVQLLKADHREVEKLFRDFQKASGNARKTQLARKVCMEILIHSQIEEELVYPTSREFLQDDDIVNEAIVEHSAAKDLIGEIRGMDASDEMFDARMQVLQEQIEHHVQEEEKEFFPRIQKTGMDLKGIGQALMERKKDLMGRMKGDAGMGGTH